MKKNSEIICAFVEGRVVPLKEVEDPVFASGTLGRGIAIRPQTDLLRAPCDGRIDTVADTGHALTMTSSGGAQLLIHVGIDTVELGGRFFEPKVKPGKRVKKGDKLIEFNRAKIEFEGYDTTICLALCNSNAYESPEMTDQRQVKPGDTLMTLSGL